MSLKTTLMLIVISLVIGFAAGRWLQPVDTSPPPNPVKSRDIEAGQPQSSLADLVRERRFAALLEQIGDDTDLLAQAIGSVGDAGLREESLSYFVEHKGDYFDGLIRLAELTMNREAYVESFDRLLRADRLTRDSGDQDRLDATLAALVSRVEERALAAGEHERLVVFLRRVTRAMPEKSEYLLQLGELQLRLGDYPSAMQTLAQVQNHHELGESARALMSRPQIEAAPGEVIALARMGDQFVVEAVIDQGPRLALLIDTGAAVTVLRSEALLASGHSPGSNLVLFATANGVVEAPLVTVEQLSVGNASVGPIAIGSLLLELPSDVDGLLGMNFLRHFEFRIDQQASQLILQGEL